MAWAVAVDGQRTAQLPGCQRAAVKAKAVAIFAGGESEIENARQIFRRDPNSIIRDGYP